MPHPSVAFILDASGSMLEALGGTTRLAAAQDAVTELSAHLPPEMNAALWVYGHRVEQDDKAASCQDIEEVLSLGPVDVALFDAVAHSFGAKGYTPIAESIRRAAESLPVGDSGYNSIVLVSDGEETCGGDPCAEAEALQARGVKVTIHSIGFAANPATRAQLQCISEVTGGTYRDAADAEELGLALEGAVGDALTKGPEWTGSLRVSCFAYPMDEKVDFHGWPVGAEVTLQIDDPDTGPGTDYQTLGFAEVAPWNPESSIVWLDFRGVYDLQPGHLITCSGAGFTKEHTVTGLAILGVDAENDIVRGVATPGGELEVILNPPDTPVSLALTAGLDGNWQADFGGLFDIDSGTTLAANEFDDDRDATSISWP